MQERLGSSSDEVEERSGEEEGEEDNGGAVDAELRRRWSYFCHRRCCSFCCRALLWRELWPTLGRVKNADEPSGSAGPITFAGERWPVVSTEH